MRIAFVTSSWDAMGGLGGVGIYRALMPAKALRMAGHETCITPNALVNQQTGEIRALDADGHSLGSIDVVVYVAPPPGDFADTIRPAQNAGQMVFMDCDDWFLGLDHAHPMRKAVLFDPQVHIANTLRALTLADGVIFSTPYLAEQLASKTRQHTVIRNMIDLSMPWKLREQGENPIIGWTGRTNFRPDDLKMMRGILRPTCELYGLTVHHVGHVLGHLSASEGFGIDRSTTRDSCGFEDYMASLDFDIGIVPLADTRFSRGKSWLKRLEYAACGIPSIATDLPEQRALMNWGLATKPTDWTRQLCALLNRERRVELASASLTVARANDVTVRGHEWVDVIEGWVGDRPIHSVVDDWDFLRERFVNAGANPH